MVDQAYAAIVAVLHALANPAVAEGQERYMKGVVRYYGIKTPDLRARIKAESSLWKPLDADARIALAWRLLRSDYFEEKDWGIAVLRSVGRSLDEAWLAELESEFGAIVRGWATCDALCGAVFRPMLATELLRRHIVAWKDSSDPWLQRAAAVAFVNEARHGLHNQTIVEVCTATVRNPHRFVQLGAGWVLRELSVADRALVAGFLVDHARWLSAEAVRYALEKYPADERKSLAARLRP